MPETWNEEILQIVRAKNGVISVQEIYSEMVLLPLVTPYHREPWKKGGQPRYQCTIRRCLTTLCRRGEVRRVGHGLYRRN